MDHLHNFWTANGQLILAGAAGGLVRWLTLREDWRAGLISVTVGLIMSVYVGPFAIWMLTPVITFAGGEPEQLIGLGGFLVGIGGIVVSGFFIDVWRMRAKLLKNGGPNDGQA